ncbi:pentatricopeptide repeat-containing protein At1g11290, chloroplastic-like [Wolffia australiana]
MARWVALIRAHLSAGRLAASLHLFLQMRRAAAAADPHAVAAAAKSCRLLQRPRLGFSLHALSLSSGLSLHPFVQTSLLNLYSSLSTLSSAHQLFDEMPIKPLPAWNTLVAAYARNSQVNASVDLLNRMRVNGVDPDPATLFGVLSGGTHPRLGPVVHSLAVKLALTSDLLLSNALISMYGKLGLVNASVSLVNAMEENQRSTATWTALVNAYVTAGDHDRAAETFNRMRRCRQFYPLDEAAVVSLISACAATAAAHGLVVKLGFCGCIRAANSLISGYCQVNDLRSAAQIFAAVHDKDVVTWTAMIAGYVAIGAAADALTLFDQMTSARVNTSCKLRTALVNLLGKSGDGIDRAREIFSGGGERDLALWSSMVNTYSLRGMATEAIELFEEMTAQGVDPDGSMFTSLISACRHAGMVKEGVELFLRMRDEYGIEPTGEHHVCMADLLGRGGHVGAAMEAAAMAPPGVMWRRARVAALSGGDKVVVEMGEKDEGSSEEKLLIFRSLALMGRWEEAAEMRRKMEEKGLPKKPAWSRLDIPCSNL